MSADACERRAYPPLSAFIYPRDPLCQIDFDDDEMIGREAASRDDGGGLAEG